MRPRFRVLLFALLSACGGSTSTTTPTGGTAATITVVAGDGQLGEPGANVTVRPVVVVKDSAGRGVAGVSVSFAVDSGGGSLQAASATTAADGTASPGDWRLGASEGRNVLRATAGSLSPVRFHADGRFGLTRNLFSAQNVGVAGGTLRYTRSGDALNGLEIDVPANAYSGSTTWTVSADSTVQVPLPADFSQVGPVLVIRNDQGYADSLIAVTVPMRVSADNAVEPFFFDAASGTLEGVPLLARSDSSITFASRHFSGSLMAIPGSAPGPSGLRSAASVFNVFRAFGAFGAPPGEFGVIKMVFIRIPQSDLIGTFTSTFRPGQDDWEFVNHGDYQGPDGNCEGMTVTAVYYHYFFRVDGAPPLFGRFDQFLTNDWDNVRGIHLAGAVQADVVSLFPTMKVEKDAIRNAVAKYGVTVQNLASDWILFNLKLNQRPLVIAVFGGGRAHALVAYAATATAGSVVVGIANPNLPGVAQTLTFQGGNMVPMPYSAIANGPSNNYTVATVFGVTSDIPLTNLNSRWAEFIAGTPGEDRLPKPRVFEVYDSVNATWGTLPDMFWLVADTLVLRMRCPNCPGTFNGADGSGLENLVILDAPGTTQIGSAYVPRVPFAVGTRSFFAKANAQLGGSSFSDPAYFLDGRLFTVKRLAASIAPASPTGTTDDVIDLTLSITSAPGNLEYSWDFADGPLVTTTTLATTHQWATAGTYATKVTARDQTTKQPVAKASVIVIITPGIQAWKFTSTSVAFSVSQPPVFEANSYDSRWRVDSTILARIHNGDTQGGFRIVDQAFTADSSPLRTAPVGLYLLEGTSLTLANLLGPATQNTFSVVPFWAAPLAFPAAPQVSGWNVVQQAAPENPLCNLYENSYVFTESVTSRHLTGLRVPVCLQNNDFPSVTGRRLLSMDVDVTFEATTATGTISVIYYFYGNSNPLTWFQRSARLTFTATRMVN